MRVTDLVWKLAHVSGFSLFAASAEAQAEVYAAVLPLIASGEIMPAHDPILSARAGARGAAPSGRGPTVRQGDPDRGREFANEGGGLMSRPIGSEHGRGTVASDIQSAQVGPCSTSMTAHTRVCRDSQLAPRSLLDRLTLLAAAGNFCSAR
jgi:hypothetical protein